MCDRDVAGQFFWSQLISGWLPVKAWLWDCVPWEWARPSWPHLGRSSNCRDPEDPEAGRHPLDPLIPLAHVIDDKADSRKGKQHVWGLLLQPLHSHSCSQRSQWSLSLRGEVV